MVEETNTADELQRKSFSQKNTEVSGGRANMLSRSIKRFSLFCSSALCFCEIFGIC